MPEGKVGAEQTGARWLGAREYPRDPAATAGAAAAHSRSLRNGLIALALVTGAVIALVMAVPKVDQVGRRLSEGSAPWLALAGLCELGSCLGYVIVFQLVFYRGPSRMVTRLAWSELAANSIVPAGGLGGLGLGAWVLSTRGVPPGRIAERSAVMFILTSVPSFAAVIVVGALLTTGAVPGRGDFVRSALPASLALAAVVAVAALPRVIGRLDARLGHRRRVRAGLGVLADATRAATFELRRGDWRLLGAVAYMALDLATLWACFHAVGGAPPLAGLMMAYLLGQLGGLIPLPAGAGAVDGGLLGALVAYGAHVAPAAAAVLAYRVLSLWLPALLGTGAFLALRRHLNDPLDLKPPRRER